MIGNNKTAQMKIALYILFTYAIFFLIPLFYLDLSVGVEFWYLIAASILFVLYGFYYGSHMIQFYLVYFIFILLFPYYIQFLFGIHFIPGITHPVKLESQGVLLMLIHLSGIMIGSLIYGKPLKYKDTRRPLVPFDFLLIGPSIWLMIILFAIGAVGAQEIFAPRIDQSTNELSSVVSFSIKLAKASSFVLVLFCIRYWFNSNLRIQHKVPILFLLGLAIFVANPVNTPRFISLPGALMILIYYLSVKGKLGRFRQLMLAMPFIAVVVLPFTSLLRYGFSGISYAEIFSIFSGLEFSSIQMLIDGMAVSEELSRGNYVISALLVFIPRSIFMDKAESLGVEVAELSGFIFTNSAVPTFFSAYVDYGLIGVFIFSMILGYVLQWVQLRNGMNVKERQDGYRLILFALTPIIVRGDMSTAMISIYAFFAAYEIFRSISFLVFKKSPMSRCLLLKKLDNRMDKEKSLT